MADPVVLLLAIGGVEEARKPKEEGKNRVPAFRPVVSATEHLLGKEGLKETRACKAAEQNRIPIPSKAADLLALPLEKEGVKEVLKCKEAGRDLVRIHNQVVKEAQRLQGGEEADLAGPVGREESFP